MADALAQRDPVPAVVLWVKSERALDTLTGPLGMDQPTIQIDCYDNNRSGASDLRLKVRDHIGGFAGVVAGVFIKGIAQDRGTVERVDRVRSGSDQYRFVAYQEFRVSYNSVPD